MSRFDLTRGVILCSFCLHVAKSKWFGAMKLTTFIPCIALSIVGPELDGIIHSANTSGSCPDGESCAGGPKVTDVRDGPGVNAPSRSTISP